MKKGTVSIISHTHWDREWYLNSPYTNEWLLKFFDSLFGVFQKKPDFKFVLDGQTLILEDYLDELNKKGLNIEEYKNKIKYYVEKGNLVIGPYYMQTDWKIVDEECLVRNILYGLKTSKEFGKPMMIGWLLDNFGQVSQCPQIHKKFGIDSLVVWRGAKFKDDNVKSEFIWQSPDESEVLASYLIASYRNGMRLGEFKEIFKRRIESEFEKIKDFTFSNNVLIMNGYDQEIYPDDVLELLEDTQFEDIEVKQLLPQEYFENIKKYKEKMIKISEILDCGKLISVFPGVISTRNYLKIQNYNCETKLIRQLEPLIGMGYILGQSIDIDRDTIWRTLLKNHPHDSICGVSIDDVHRDMEDRYKIVEKFTSEGIEKSLLKIIPLIDTNVDSKKQIVIFNLYPLERKEIIVLEDNYEGLIPVDEEGKDIIFERADGKIVLFLEKIRPFGFKRIFFKEKDNREIIKHDGIKVYDNVIENKFFLIKINENGTFDLYDKETKREYKNLCYFEDEADAGDEYNFSHIINDEKINTLNLKPKIEIVEESSLRIVARIEYVLSLPEKLEDNLRSNKRIDLPIVNYITIEADSKVIKFKTFIKNTAKDHRLRVLFPTNIKTDFVDSYTQYDIYNEKVDVDPEYYEIPDSVKRIIKGAREPFASRTKLTKGLIDINDKSEGLAILTKGLYEYEVIKDNVVAITLFRAVDRIAKENLLTREGDAGPNIFTPEAECLREMVFEYAVIPHDCNIDLINYHALYNSPLIIVETDRHRGTIKKDLGFIELLDKNVKVTSIKPSEDGQGLIIRFVNLDENEKEISIRTLLNAKKASKVTLIEDEIESLQINNGGITINVKPKEITTIKIVYEGKEDVLEKAEFNLLNESDFSEDFSNYISSPLVTLEDVEKERERAIKLFELMKASKTDLEKESFNRAYLEAEISYLLAKRTLLEMNKDKNLDEYESFLKELDEKLRDIGYKLNLSRVKKRALEMVEEYL